MILIAINYIISPLLLSFVILTKAAVKHLNTLSNEKRNEVTVFTGHRFRRPEVTYPFYVVCSGYT